MGSNAAMQRGLAGGLLCLVTMLCQGAGLAGQGSIEFYTGGTSVDAAGNTSGLADYDQPDPAFWVVEGEGLPVTPFRALTTSTFTNFGQWGSFDVLDGTRAIGPTINSGHWGAPPHWGSYVVRYYFELGPTQFPTALVAQIVVDDWCDVFLNGHLLASITTASLGHYPWWQPAAEASTTDAALFRVGTNVLEFDVLNHGDDRSPTALDVRGQVWHEPRVCVDARNRTGAEDGSVHLPFNTIQEGIDVAPDGGIVQVARGTYAGSLTVQGKSVTIKGGFVGGTYPGAGDFDEANRDPDPTTNETVIDGDGSPILIMCQDAAARGSALTGLTFANGGAILRGGPLLQRVIAAPRQ